MSFTAPPDAYDRFMGRYSRPLASLFASFAGVGPGMRVLDVGSGPGALTEVLAELVGAESVSAAEPSAGFAAACAQRVPGADVREAPAERLPWGDASFDAALAQLVVAFVSDAPASVREMLRVARPGAVVAACSWDVRGEMRMLRTFWEAAVSLDPAAPADGDRLRHSNEGELRALWLEAGLEDVRTGPLELEVVHEDFDEFWMPFGAGIGPAGSYCASLEPGAREALREECRRRLGDPQGSFALQARAWAVRGHRPVP